MKLIVDGKEVKFDYQVKVIYEDELFCGDKGEEVSGEMHMTITEEGVIVDLYEEENGCPANPNYTMAWDKEYFIEEAI